MEYEILLFHFHVLYPVQFSVRNAFLEEDVLYIYNDMFWPLFPLLFFHRNIRSFNEVTTKERLFILTHLNGGGGVFYSE